MPGGQQHIVIGRTIPLEFPYCQKQENSSSKSVALYHLDRQPMSRAMLVVEMQAAVLRGTRKRKAGGGQVIVPLPASS